MKDDSPLLDGLLRSSTRLAAEKNLKGIASVLVEQSADYARTDLCCLYFFPEGGRRDNSLRLYYRRGDRRVPGSLDTGSVLVDFIIESRESVVLTDRRGTEFDDLFLNEDMRSGMALPLMAGREPLGILYCNSRSDQHFGRSRTRFLSSISKLAGELMQNARLMSELRDHLRTIEELERYQESIFESMTNLLVTTDKTGNIRYFNKAAGEAFLFDSDAVGQPFGDKLGSALGKKIDNLLTNARSKGREYAGLEGILRVPERSEMDYSLNVAPLKGANGRLSGQTLLFTDQTREQEFRKQADVAVEDRRKIKDMFSRYLSKDLVTSLTDNPALVKPGGDKKTATVFFADITGYTSFSEGRDPAYIIEVLNGFFEEAVELVIDRQGYIDKFIGDCIMAAWGVPMKTEVEDAVLAVETALSIHELVRSPGRKFFTGEASKLKISIGMSSGPLVAGNVGSQRRMDYTVLGDTVNTAARLESVAVAEEIIISAATRDLLGDRFKLEERKPVRVKGKDKPLVIFNVKGMN